MHTVKEKVGNAAAVAKEHVDIMKAKTEEKAAKAAAATREEKEIAHERRKAKEAEAKMEMHEAKAENAAEKLDHHHHLYGHHGAGRVGGGQLHQHHEPVGTVLPTTAGTTAPSYPLGGHPPGHNKYV